MQIRFYTDPASGAPHIYNYGVAESEVEDRPGRELQRCWRSHESRVAIGRTSGGRFLRVIYVPDPEPSSVFVITAYELRGKPLAAFRRRRGRDQ